MNSTVRQRIRGLVLATGAVLLLGACGATSYSSAADAKAALEKGGMCAQSEDYEDSDLPAGVSAGMVCDSADQEQGVIFMLFKEGSGQDVFMRGHVADAKSDPEVKVVTGGNWMAIVEKPDLAGSVAEVLGGTVEA
jgi:hypothetical protein